MRTPFDAPVSQYMSSPVRSITADAPLNDAHTVLREHAISSLAVLDESGRMVGVVSRTDLLRVGRMLETRVCRAPLLALPEGPVRDVMHASVVRVSPQATVAAAARTLVAQKIHRVFVTEGDVLAGVISTTDVLRAIRDSRRSTPISEYMSAPVMTVRASDTLARATDRLVEGALHGVVVVDEEDWPVGLFTQSEALQCRALSAALPVDEQANPSLLCMDVKTPVHRAAARAAETRARRVIAVEGRRIWGILTGIDFARVAAQG